MTCFPIFWRSKKNSRENVGTSKQVANNFSTSKKLAKKYSSHENVVKIKVVNARVWPGDGLSPKIEVSIKSDVENMEQEAHGSNSHSDASAPTIFQLGSRSSSSFQACDKLEDDESCSVSSHLKHVEEWVNNLDELANEKPRWDDAEEEEEEDTSCSSCVSKEFEPEADTSSDLNDIIFKSLSMISTSANFSGIGMTVVPVLGAFGNLRSLSLSANSIAKIPPGCLPKNLQELDLSKNKISTTEGLRNLTKLRMLNLSHNRISRIGHGLANCTSIRELYLSGNKISAVEGLHRLRKILLLDLSHNKLATTKSLMQLAANYSSLQVLILLENPVLVNHSEEQLRRFVNVVVPRLTYLNMQSIKAVPSREASLGKFTLASGGRNARKTARKSPASKAKRVENLQARHSYYKRSRRYLH